MNSVIQLSESDDKTLRQKTFRKQFADNLNAALDRRGAIPSGYGRVVAVAELFGVSQNTAANWLKGEGVPELFRLPEIAEALSTTVEHLVVGDRGSGTHVIDERYAVVDVHEDDTLEGHSWYTLPETLRSVGLPRDIRMLQVASDDMAPYVSQGDLVIYDPRVNRIQTNGVFVLQTGGHFIVRRVQRGIKQSIRLICDNTLFGDETLTEADFVESDEGDDRVVVIGHVVGRMQIGS
jgi:transcriptional regulator with XRE-family HTH domain